MEFCEMSAMRQAISKMKSGQTCVLLITGGEILGI